MIKIFVNDQEIEIEKNSCISDALVKAGFDSNKTQFAVAVNCEFIPRSLYTNTLLKPNDVIEVLTAMQGG